MARQKLAAADVVTDLPEVPAPGRQKLTASDLVEEEPPTTSAGERSGIGETVLHHGLKGLTLNFSDRLAGVGTVIGDKLASLVHDVPATPTAQAYDEGRQEERDTLARTARDHEYVALGSQLAGGLAVPVPGAAAAKGASFGAKAVRAGLVGAGAGAVAGAGASREIEDMPGIALKGAGLGLGLGLAGGAAVGAPGKLAELAKNNPKLAEALKKALEDKAASAASGAAGSVVGGLVGGGIAGHAAGFGLGLVVPKAVKAVGKLLTRGEGAAGEAAGQVASKLEGEAAPALTTRELTAAPPAATRAPVTEPAASAPATPEPAVNPVKEELARKLRDRGPKGVPQEDRSTVQSLVNIVSSHSRAGNTPNLVHYPVEPEVAFRQYLDELPKSTGGSPGQATKALVGLKLGSSRGEDIGELLYRARAAGASDEQIMRAVGVSKPAAAGKGSPPAPRVPTSDEDLAELLRQSVEGGGR